MEKTCGLCGEKKRSIKSSLATTGDLDIKIVGCACDIAAANEEAQEIIYYRELAEDLDWR